MRNIEAIKVLIEAAESATDPLDATACQRAAVWLRWCDGFGATLTDEDAKRFSKAGALGEAARGLIRRLFQEFPPPSEDGGLRYLVDEEEGGEWMQRILNLGEISVRKDAQVENPFELSDPRP